MALWRLALAVGVLVNLVFFLNLASQWILET